MRIVLMALLLLVSVSGWANYFETIKCHSNLILKVKTDAGQLIKVSSDFRRNLKETQFIEMYTKQNLKVGVLHPHARMSVQFEKSVESHAKIRTNNLSFFDLSLSLSRKKYSFRCDLDL